MSSENSDDEPEGPSSATAPAAYLSMLEDEPYWDGWDRFGWRPA